MKIKLLIGGITAMTAVLIALKDRRKPSIPAAVPQYLESNDSIQYSKRVLSLMNALRASQGIHALEWNKVLYQSALKHAEDMAERNYFNHNTPEGITPTERAREVGWTSGMGENIAAGQSTPEQVLQAWKDSPGHYRNMIDRIYTSVGIAYYFKPDSTFKYYWVANFGV